MSLLGSPLVGTMEDLTDQVTKSALVLPFTMKAFEEGILGSNNLSISIAPSTIMDKSPYYAENQEAAKDYTQLFQKLTGKADEK